MATVARLKQGDLTMTGDLVEVRPSVQSGLVVAYPLDETTAGECWFGWSGSRTANSAIQDVHHSYVYIPGGASYRFLVEMRKSGGLNGSVNLYNYHKIDGTWSYQGHAVTGLLVENEWVQIEVIGTCTGSGTLTNFNQGISLRENNTQGTLEWRNGYLFVYPTTDTTVETPQGIGIETTTTNIVVENSGYFGWYGNYDDRVEAIIDWSCPTAAIGDPRVVRLTKYANGQVSYNGNTITHDQWHGTYKHGGCAYQTTLTGEYYSYSGWYRLTSATDTPMTSLDCVLYNNVDWGSRGSTSVTMVPDGQWHYFNRTFQQTSDGDVYPCWQWSYDWGWQQLELCGLQIERKPYTSAYTSGTRSVQGQLIYEHPDGLTAWTIAGEFIPDSRWKSNDIYAYTANQSPLIGIHDTVNVGNCYYRYYTGGTSSSPFLDPDGYYGTSHIHQTVEIDDHVPVYFVMRKSGTSLTMKLFQSGAWKATHTLTVPTDVRLDKISFGYDPVSGKLWSGVRRNMVVYNRAISDAEADKLARSGWNILDTGDVTTGEGREGVAMPSNAVYFPLYENGNDVTGTVAPTDTANCVFYDGAVWVGSAASNVVTNTNLDTGWSKGYCTDILWNDIAPPPSVDSQVVSFIDPDGGSGYWYCYGNYAPQADGTTYTTSIWARSETDFNIRAYTADNSEVDRHETNTVTVPGDLVWHRIEFDPFTTAASCDSDSLSFVFPSVPANKRIWLCAPQLESTPYPSPFMVGSRSAGSLEYNLYNAIGLDWSGNWTIVYWKKPMGTQTGTLTGYSIESLGCNSNSVGGGYQYWGKESGSNTLRFSSTFTPSDYFNHWHMISLSKSGSTVTVRYWHVGNTVYSGTFTSTTSVANYYVTQHGYDLKLGGWDNGNPVNAYYRDLMVIKGTALTEAQLKVICDTQMRARNGSLQVAGQFFEGDL